MKIFRTDGGGISYVDERLFRLVKTISKRVENDFWEIIEKIEDHKGDLHVTLKIDSRYIDFGYYFAVFYMHWIDAGESNVNIYYNNICVEGYNLNPEKNTNVRTK